MMKQITSNDVPRDSDERKAWALIHLRRRGCPIDLLAEQERVTVTSLYRTLGEMSSARLEEALARALDMQTQDLFPERYTPDGKRTRITKVKRYARAQSQRSAQHG